MNSETHAFYNVAASKGRFLPVCQLYAGTAKQSEGNPKI